MSVALSPPRMSAIAAVVLCVVYFSCVLAGASVVGPAIAPWFLACLSIAVVWCFVAYARGHAGVALAVVVVVTVVLPIGALLALAWPIYESWSRSIASIWTAFQERGVLGGVELLVPPVAAALCAGVLTRVRHPPPTGNPP